MKKQLIYVVFFLFFNLSSGLAGSIPDGGGAIIIIQGKTQTTEHSFLSDNEIVNSNAVEIILFQNGKVVPISINHTEGMNYTINKLQPGQYLLVVIINGYQYQEKISVF